MVILVPEQCGLANSALGKSSLKNTPKGRFSCLLPNASGSYSPVTHCVQCKHSRFLITGRNSPKRDIFLYSP